MARRIIPRRKSQFLVHSFTTFPTATRPSYSIRRKYTPLAQREIAKANTPWLIVDSTGTLRPMASAAMSFVCLC